MKTIYLKLSTLALFLFLATTLLFSQTAGNGSPRFILQEIFLGSMRCGIKATCIDTRYEEFIRQNPDAITYQWGIKTENKPLTWMQTPAAELDAAYFADKDYVTVYFRTTDTNGNTSAPIYIRITGSDIYDLQFNTLIFNSKGEMYSDKGEAFSHKNTTMPLIQRDLGTSQPKSSPTAGKVTNDRQEEIEIPWIRYGYIRDIIPTTEVERILSLPDNTATVYKLTLLDTAKEIIQEFPVTVLYKADYPTKTPSNDENK